MTDYTPRDSLLQRQNAQDVDDSSDMRTKEDSAAQPLVPRAGPVQRYSYHRRQPSVEIQKKDGMSTGAAGEKKKLSEARKANLKIELGESGRSQTEDSECHCSENAQLGQYTNSPIGHHIHRSHSSGPHLPVGDLSTITLRIFFSEPHILLHDSCVVTEKEGHSPFGVLEIPIEGGRLAKASFLIELVAKEYNISSDIARESLAIWMESDLLQVQLKPHHSPYEIHLSWRQLLRKFTSSTPEDIMDDVPSLFVRRRVQLSVNREQEILDKCCEVREILFNDAYENFMSGRYVVGDDVEGADLVGISMAAVFEKYDKTKHSLEFLRNELESFVPEYLIPLLRGPLVFGRALSGPSRLETRLLDAWRKAPTMKKEVQLAFLALLQPKPYYGAAFFPGCIEKPRKKFSFSNSKTDVKVEVAVNHKWVTVIDESKHEVLLVQRIDQCTWRRIDLECSQMEEGAEPSLLLHFPDETTKLPATKMLQIFGRQGVMMDALLRAMRSLSQQNDRDSGAEMSDSCPAGSSMEGTVIPPRSSSPSTPPSPASFLSSSPPTSSSAISSVPSRVPSITRSNRLCLATFDSCGNCLEVQGSLKALLKTDSRVAAKV